MGILRNNKTLSLDFGSDSIKGVVGKYSGKGVTVEKCFKVELPKGLYVDGEITDLDQMTYLLRTGLSENKIGQIETHGVYNSSSVVMREVTLPKATGEEIQAIIDYQLEDYIPINPEDYVVKYLNVGTRVEDGVEMMTVLLIGIPRTALQSHLTLLRNVNLKPTIMDYHGNAIAKLLLKGGRINESYDSLAGIACVDIGSKNTGVSIVDEGVIKVARVIERGTDSIVEELEDKLPHLNRGEIYEYIGNLKDLSLKLVGEDDESIVSDVLRENLFGIMDAVEMIFRYYKTRESSNKIDLILIYGGMSGIKGMESLFNDFFESESRKIQTLENVDGDCDISQFANAIGGLIRLKEVKKK